MRFLKHLYEAEEADATIPDGTPEKTPEEEAEEQKIKDIEAIVGQVEGATDKNKINGAVKTTASMYKTYGDEWLSDLKKALSVNIVPDTVKKFITYTKNFSERLTHLKDK